MGCSELYLSDDRIVPLSLKEVHLELCPELIISRSDDESRRSDIEEIILKAGVGSSHLQCSLTSADMPRMDMLCQDFGTVVRLKFLPLLTSQKNTLVSLDISAELLVGCLKDQQAVRQIVSLRGQLPSVRRLVASSGRVLGSELFRAVTVSTADLRPLLEMFPSLSYLEVDRAYRIGGVEVDDFCRVCPCLKTLVCYSLSYADVWVARKSSPWRLETLHWLIDGEFTVEHLSALVGCVQASYILLYLNRSESALEKEHVEAVFARMPCLRWLVLVWELQRLTWICRQPPDGQTMEIVPANTVLAEDLLPKCPQLYSKLWTGLMRANYTYEVCY
ncbi:hypothetical protein SprV_0301370700 [Sparganum proliferum]